MRDLFTLGDEYANNTETSEIFASVNGEVTAALQSEQPPFPDPAELPGMNSLPSLMGILVCNNLGTMVCSFLPRSMVHCNATCALHLTP